MIFSLPSTRALAALYETDTRPSISSEQYMFENFPRLKNFAVFKDLNLTRCVRGVGTVEGEY
jgi:hypothetical protein